ncbi:MAG: PqqD family protein [Proteocatella sp.]
MVKKSKITSNDNFLELMPVHNANIRWIVTEDEVVQIQIDRNSLLDKIIRPIFKTPSVMNIDLDKYGSYIWLAIDGQKDVEAIANGFQSTFGMEVEPLYERLGSYVNILRNNNFITLEKIE